MTTSSVSSMLFDEGQILLSFLQKREFAFPFPYVQPWASPISTNLERTSSKLPVYKRTFTTELFLAVHFYRSMDDCSTRNIDLRQTIARTKEEKVVSLSPFESYIYKKVSANDNITIKSKADYGRDESQKAMDDYLYELWDARTCQNSY